MPLALHLPATGALSGPLPCADALVLTRADRLRAVAVGTAGVLVAGAGIALASDGHPFTIGLWVVFTALGAGWAWSMARPRAAADFRSLLALRALAAAAALVTAGLGLLMAGSAVVMGLVMLVALICALCAKALHEELRDMRETAARRG